MTSVLLAWIIGGYFFVAAWLLFIERYFRLPKLDRTEEQHIYFYTFVLAWPIFGPLLVIYALYVGLRWLFRIMRGWLDQAMWLLSRRKIDESELGVLYGGYHATHSAVSKYTEEDYVVLYVEDNTGKYQIRVPPSTNSVRSALAWTYHVDDYDAVRV